MECTRSSRRIQPWVETSAIVLSFVPEIVHDLGSTVAFRVSICSLNGRVIHVQTTMKEQASGLEKLAVDKRSGMVSLTESGPLNIHAQLFGRITRYSTFWW